MSAVDFSATEAVSGSAFSVEAQRQEQSLDVSSGTSPLYVIFPVSSVPQLPDPQLEQKFRRLADEWRRDTFFSSSITNNLSHPAYLRIMAMGERALPLILRELKERGGHWFMALRYIVDEKDNPVPSEHNGKIRLMTEDWLEWGRRNHYL